METKTNMFEWWQETLESSLPFWREWSTVSQLQRNIWANYRDALGGQWERVLQLAPNTLSQTINPWSFSLLQIKGNPVIERKIVTGVAGYGSQLGTIMDFLEVLEKTTHLDPTKLKDAKDRQKVEKFQRLLQDVKEVKASAASA